MRYFAIDNNHLDKQGTRDNTAASVRPRHLNRVILNWVIKEVNMGREMIIAKHDY